MKRKNGNGIIYSTDPNYQFEEESQEDISFPEPAQQLIKIRLETKHRGGKAVTLIENFLGSREQEEELGKKLKTYCGTGGSVKDGEILVQGDQRDKILQWFHKNGYPKAKKI